MRRSYMGDYKWLRKRKENRKSSKGYKEEIKTTNNCKKNVQPHSQEGNEGYMAPFHTHQINKI